MGQGTGMDGLGGGGLTRKRHHKEHWPQQPPESIDPMQHAKGRTGKETVTRRNVTTGTEAMIIYVPCQQALHKSGCKTGPSSFGGPHGGGDSAGPRTPTTPAPPPPLGA